MRTSSFVLFVAAAAAMLPACFEEKPADPGELVGELTVKDCDGMAAPFTQPATCPKPADLTADQKKAKCGEVKKVALNDYKTQFGKDPDCSEGWVFGPDGLLKSCIKDSGKNLCKLASTTPKPPDTGWPASENYSTCLNDWVVYCTDSFPAEMGIKADPKGQVCFHKDLDYDKLPATSVTAREVCQRLKAGTPKTFPDKCPDELCKPKMKPGTKKKGPTSCAISSHSDSPVSATPVPCDDGPGECAACDPATDPDCSYDLSCGCEMCEAGDTNPACSEDLECPMPTPTPSPSPTPPPPTPNPTPFPSPTPPPATPNPTPNPTPFPSPTPPPATPNPTPFPSPTPPPATPNPTPFPSATPFPHATPL